MTKQEQIEEMAQIINGSTELDTVAYYRCMNIAKTIYSAGYRKSEEVRKETAKEIYERLIELSENPCNDREEIYKEVFGRYGVEVEE